ncbi:response regulator transcription factor [Enterococcus aquimarinus]|nr:response regulator [Enterococcus aquimarinus]
MKILLADDEFFIREGLKSLEWETIGLKIVGVASNGVEALNIARKYLPDIILTDIKMPKMDGLEMSEKYLKIKPDAKIVFLSAYKDFYYVQQAMRLGGIDYLLKPTNPNEILSCCKKIKEKILNKQQEQNIIVDELTIVPQEKKDEKRNIKEILRFIDRNYMNSISLKDLADEFHFNPIYINRMIKKETQSTFLEIVNTKRMDLAADLIKSTELRIEEVAQKTGFIDQRYFSQVFKKRYGEPPGSYRQLNKVSGKSKLL